MNPRKLTGNASVDAIATMAITGNVIPATWYKTITTASGKADLAAINILSDVLYWYRPSEIRDEATGDIIAYRKRFSADLLQRSYDQLAEHFGLSKRQAKDAEMCIRDRSIRGRLRSSTTRSKTSAPSRSSASCPSWQQSTLYAKFRKLRAIASHRARSSSTIKIRITISLHISNRA